MRKSLIIILALIIGAAIGFVTVKAIKTNKVNDEYTIVNNEKDIQTHLTAWQTRGDDISTPISHNDETSGKSNPTLLKVVHLGKSDTYVAFFVNQAGDLGFGTLKEGSNGKLKIVSSNVGSMNVDNFARYRGVHSNEGNYGIVFGKNPSHTIRSANVKLLDDSYAFTIEVPDTEYFIVTKKLSKGVSSNEFADVFLLDENSKELDFPPLSS